MSDSAGWNRIAELEERLRYCHGEVIELTFDRDKARAEAEQLRAKLAAVEQLASDGFPAYCNSHAAVMQLRDTLAT
jgi:hypothetical protein